MLAEFFQYPFLVRALVGVMMLSILTALMGVFVVLRRMAFFSDAIAHATLAGIALGLLFGINPTIGAIGFALLVAMGIAATNRAHIAALDTVIGVFFAAAVALGVLVLSNLHSVRVDLIGFLFGDILALTAFDLWVIGILGVVVIVLIAVCTKPLARIAFHAELAEITGVPVRVYEYGFMLLLALVIALGVKLAGVILIGPLLIIPAAAAKNVAKDFRHMVLVAVVLSVLIGVVGLFGSYLFNTPSGPTIVLLGAVAFFLTLLARPMRSA